MLVILTPVSPLTRSAYVIFTITVILGGGGEEMEVSIYIVHVCMLLS
jgi:hypothetical protein